MCQEPEVVKSCNVNVWMSINTDLLHFLNIIVLRVSVLEKRYLVLSGTYKKMNLFLDLCDNGYKNRAYYVSASLFDPLGFLSPIHQRKGKINIPTFVQR